MEPLFTYLADAPPQVLAKVMHTAKFVCWLAMVLVVWVVVQRSFRRGQPKTVTRAYRTFFILLAVLFMGVLAYQSTWQLGGFVRGDFVDFMKRYNRRSVSPTAQMVRGSILDARGHPLAEDHADQPGRRWYPEGAALAHLVGYLHPLYGMTGVEAAEHAALSGTTRTSEVERDQFRRNLLRRDALRGHVVTLTVLRDLQREAHSLMKDRKGAVVLLDPSDGAILCLYSSPGYDPNKLEPTLFEGKDPNAPMLNRALQGLYPPGSTFKVMVAAAALEAGMHPRYDCPGEGVRFGTGNRPIRDHEYYAYERQGRTWPGHGVLNMRDALTKSSNIYFARLGVDLGGIALYDAVARSGLLRGYVLLDGASDPIRCASGRFPVLTDESKAKTAQVSIGQGDMLVTPLHMALLAASIGRQGTRWAPRLDPAQPPVPLDPFISAESARVLAGLMRYAVRNGTGSGADIAGLDVAGKTGTAQNPHGDDHSWFIGFAPVNDPRLAFAVVVEHGGYGSRSAVPVAAGLLEKARAIGWFGALGSTHRSGGGR